jgi:sortase A
MTSLGVRLSGWRARVPTPAWLHGGGQRAVAAELSTTSATAQWALVGLAAVALWLGLFGAGISALPEQHAQHGLYAKFRNQLALGTASLGGAVAEGTPVAMVQSAAGGLHGIVVAEGTSSADLRSGPGHLPGTVLPGQAGVSVLMGRSVSYGGPFRHIADLHAGEAVVVTTAQGRFKYVVSGVRRAGDRLPAALPAGGSQLTLVTSEGTGWRSGWAPTHAVMVDAVLKGKAAPPPSTTGIPRAVDQPMHRDSSRLYALVLWLQLLVIAVVGIVIARARWGAWQSWLIGLPVVAAALWGASNTAAVLLPNLV